MNKLNLAIVGCGDIAGFTALVSRLIPRLRLSACCDVDAERARLFARRHHIPLVFSDFTELLTQTPADAVYLAVPHHLHYRMILQALEAGLPVLVEKPLTRTYQEGVELMANQAGRKVAVNYQYRYDRGCYAMAQAVHAGALGPVHSIRINVPWHRDRSYFETAAWHKTLAEAGGGTLITQASHFLDAALWALDDLPVSAMGYTASPGFDVEVDTLTHAILETRRGCLISLTSSMVAAPARAVTIEIYGERATALYRDQPFPSVKFIRTHARSANQSALFRRQAPPVWGVHALQRSLSAFTGWILDDQPYLTPAASSLPVLAAVDAVYRSAQTGQKAFIEGLDSIHY